MTATIDTIRHSYAPEDVTALLTPLDIPTTDIREKEQLIQSGQAHYSEMLSEERRPDQRYLDIYEAALLRGKMRIAGDIARIALGLKKQIEEGYLCERLSLCSLVRAGMPYGVLLRRALRQLDVDVAHYGVSIIRDRGLDAAAMSHVRAERRGAEILFVDGWTGKGAISNELARSWREISGKEARLIVLADPSGHAWLSGSYEDWLIPSGILGANVSGLISRSILRPDLLGPGDFHGAMRVEHLADIDRSVEFVDRVSKFMSAALECEEPALENRARRSALRLQAATCVQTIATRYEVGNLNRIKPGIAEATRAVLRRRPHRVFLRDAHDPDLAALVHLCATDGIDMEVDADLTGPYRAITLIEKVG